MMESVCSFGIVVRRVGFFSYKPRAENCLVFRRVRSHLARPLLYFFSSFGGWGVSLTRPVLVYVLSVVGRRVSFTRTDVLVGVSSRVGGDFL